MATDLLSIPQDLLLRILAELDAGSLIRCGMTCKSMHETVKSTPSLQYALLLHLEGLRDTRTSTSPGYHELIEQLVRRRRERMLLRPNVLKRDSIELPGGHERHALVGNVFANLNQRHELDIVWLPTPDNLEEVKVQRIAQSINTRFFAMDPGQDMIALVEEPEEPVSSTDAYIIRIHIRTISTDTVHPLAKESPLVFSIFYTEFWSHFFLESTLSVAQTSLALHTQKEWKVKRLLIWDWRTSDLLLDSSLSLDPSLSDNRAFRLLTADLFVLTDVQGSGSIRLYKLVYPDVIDTSPSTPTHLATFHLPQTVPGCRTEYVHINAGPIAAHPLPFPGTSHNTPPPYLLNDDDHVHRFILAYHHEIIGVERVLSKYYDFEMYVHQRVFARYYRFRYSEQVGVVAPVDVPWAEWGPANTRIVQAPYGQLAWTGDIRGQCVVAPMPSAAIDSNVSGNISSAVEILDFSLAAIMSLSSSPQSQSQSPLEPWSDFAVLCAPSRIKAASDVTPYQEDVETYLPCVSSKLNIQHRHSAYKITEDSVIGVNTASHRHGLSVVLSIYPIDS
ncbi:hypothetical protein BDN70DRAFT_877099 [Pholiota conissans]|uniref:F-box domain-containing protein n=1 Tax=Pholiota conissans TaxID=109636 RepID=A0A9P6D1Z5_9AGAR|nr:hypothetical protein BDN70DRAFT_877099 [Pholiota conissans]